MVGDFRGADTMAQEFLFHEMCLATGVVVYHMYDWPRNNPCWYPTVGGFLSDGQRDAAMTRTSDIDIAWVRPGREKSGTARNLAGRKKLGP